jgi:cell division septal protein FtsQ
MTKVFIEIMQRKYTSSKLIQRKRRIKKIKITLYVILFLSLIFGFFYAMKHPKLNVSVIDIVDNTFSNTSKLEARVSSSLDGNVFFFIPKTNALFLPRFEIEESIKEEAPEISTIDIDLKGFNNIEVSINEFEPKLLLEVKDKNYFVNEFGDVFMEAPLLHSHDDLLSFFNDLEEVEIRDNVIDADFLRSINLFSEKLNNLDIRVHGVSHEGEDVYYIKTDLGFDILVSSQDNLEISFENIKTILENGTLSREQLPDVNYIDLRFGNKVFYKLRE